MQAKQPIFLACAFLLLLGGATLLTLAGGTIGVPPTLTVDQPAAAIRAGGIVSGLASDEDATLVKVQMYIDGELVAEDDVMDGDVNSFSFDIPADAEGKELKIVAVSSDGGTAENTYRVRQS